MPLFLLMPIILIALIVIYLYRRVLKSTTAYNIEKKRGRMISAAVSVLLILPLAGFLWGWRIPAIIALYFYMILMLYDLIAYIVRRISKKELTAMKLIHTFALIPLLCTAIVFTIGSYNIKNVRETVYTVHTDKAIRESGYKIAVLSDIHYGLLDNKSDMQSLADAISSKNVDLVLLCGDIVDENTGREQMDELLQILGQIKSSFGTYYVYGNHDPAKYAVNPPYTVAELEASLAKNGISILTDEKVTVTDDLVLIGRKDRASKRKTVAELLEGTDASQYILLMDHQPYEFAEKESAGVDLQISGHTHAGQIFPVGLIIEFFHIGDMNYGLKQFGSMNAVVTSGVTGWGFPIRTEGISEYVIIDIKP